ncbi:UPF0565 protein C2orf69 [Liparis tanakae]|uniref:UPF0565 protein C2orf69 n=1 Tax=Liparis tanakae TaxID=230148 RepID=A0A4Z2G9T6_9TELE|nr:UPF0565 protein C2orf69 [Liparis tanakae]
MLRVDAAPRAAVAHNNMTSATSSPEAPGLSASASRSARAGSPRQRLQKLLSVPGYEPRRVNDLLLLRPDADHRAAAGPEEEEEEGRNRHVVFFHGDIQVRVMEGEDTCCSGGH